MIVCADMKNVYNHASSPINRIDCALYQCVRVIAVPAWMLKLGNMVLESLLNSSTTTSNDPSIALYSVPNSQTQLSVPLFPKLACKIVV